MSSVVQLWWNVPFLGEDSEEAASYADLRIRDCRDCRDSGAVDGLSWNVMGIVNQLPGNQTLRRTPVCHSVSSPFLVTVGLNLRILVHSCHSYYMLLYVIIAYYSINIASMCPYFSMLLLYFPTFSH